MWNKDCGRKTEFAVIYRSVETHLVSRKSKAIPIIAPPSPKSTSSTDSSSSSSSSSSPSSRDEQRANGKNSLSRRQRKNRREQRKEDCVDGAKKDQKSSVKPAKIENRSNDNSGMSKIWVLVRTNQIRSLYKLNFELPYLNQLDDQQFMLLLMKHTLTKEQMRCHGFPIWHKDNYATFFNTRKGRHHSSREWEIVLQHFYRNPEPFYHNEDIEYVSTESNSSSTDEEDSGHGSSGSTPSSATSSDVDGSSESDSSDSSSSPEIESCSRSNIDNVCNVKSPQGKKQPAHKRDCTRCHKHFYLSAKTGDYIFEEECYYHWGKIRRNNYAYSWECCGAHEHSRGCTVARWHVWSGTLPGHNGPFHDYARTISPPYTGYKYDLNQGVFALDCEMVFTKNGMEVAKVSIVNLCNEVIYDTLIKPSAPVIDYNTRFSGLRPSDLANITKTLGDVQTDILSFVNTKTILIGHSLESDLRALKIIHMNVIDTSIVYPHNFGPPLRRSLKELVCTELQKSIQVGEHDSAEDARAVVDLVLLKMQRDIAWMYRFNTPYAWRKKNTMWESEKIEWEIETRAEPPNDRYSKRTYAQTRVVWL